MINSSALEVNFFTTIGTCIQLHLMQYEHNKFEQYYIEYGSIIDNNSVHIYFSLSAKKKRCQKLLSMESHMRKKQL